MGYSSTLVFFYPPFGTGGIIANLEMKPSLFTLVLSLLTFRCFSQTLSPHEQTWLLSRLSTNKIEIPNRNVDTILSSAAYWGVLATFDGKMIRTKEDLGNRSFKFVKDGRLFGADNYAEKPSDIFSGKWSFNVTSNQLIITVGPLTRKIYQL
jgi:hypothetical protein